MSFAAVILAAGKSKRMKSALPKAAHPICGKPITRHVVDACLNSGIKQIIVVVGHEAEVVKKAIGDDVLYAVQQEQLGTGHAAMQAIDLLDQPDVLVLPGDAPLITPEELHLLMEAYKNSESAATLLTAILDMPVAYGRIIRGPDGSVERIIEARDASPEVLEIREVGTSFYCFNTALLKESLAELKADNAQGEYYLTDVIEILRRKGHAVSAVVAADARDILGINTRVELADAANIMRRRLLDALMLDGVTIVDPGTTYVDVGVTIGRDTVIQPCTVIEGCTKIGSGCIIGPFVRLTNAVLGNKVKVAVSAVEDAEVASGTSIGPFESVKGSEGRT